MPIGCMEPEAAVITILAIGYRTQCTEPGCRNLARESLRNADRLGRPLFDQERCHAHAREALAQETKAGLTIYNQRN